MWFDTSTSDRPQYVPLEFSTLPACVAIDNESWNGSGFQLEDVLDRYALMSFDAEVRTCGACQSSSVQVIFVHYFHHPNESDVRFELVCNACHKFTQRAFSR